MTTKVVYAIDYETRSQAALYVNGRKALDAPVYDIGPFDIVQALINHNVIRDIVLEDIEVDFEGFIDFPNDFSVLEKYDANDS